MINLEIDSISKKIRRWVCSVTNNLLAFSSKIADTAATGTDKRSVCAISGDNTTRAAKSQGFYNNLLAIAVDNVSRNNITATSQQFSNKLLATKRLLCWILANC